LELFSSSNSSHSLLPVAAALGAALLLCAVCSFALSAPAAQGLPRVMFACLPPLAFALQEPESLWGQQQPGRVAIDVEIVVLTPGRQGQEKAKQEDRSGAAHGTNCVTACHWDTGGEAGSRIGMRLRLCIWLK